MARLAIESCFHSISVSTQSGFNDFSKTSSEALSGRKHQRASLVRVRLIVSKVLLVLCLGGILVTIVNDQLILLSVYDVCSSAALGLKTLTSLLTALLLVFIWIFTYIQMKLFMNLRSIDDIKTAFHINRHRLVLLILETVVCAIHPLPVCMDYGEPPDAVSPFNRPEPLSLSQNLTDRIEAVTPTSPVPALSTADALLSILMFLRLYHIGRFLVLHSRLFRTMLSYSLGALAHTKYNFVFIFKSYMAQYKGYLLATIALTFTSIAAWCIYICDRDITRYQDAVWVVGITFFTVGYGDISPVSKCSQAISVITGFFGMFCMGISVTIVSRYLQLTFDEYCMLSYYLESELEKQRQHASAMIIAATWQEYRCKKAGDIKAAMSMRRKLHKAFHMKKDTEYRKISSRERRERQVPLYDMKEQMKKLIIRAEYVHKRQMQMEETVKTMGRQLSVIQDKLTMLYQLTRRKKQMKDIKIDGSTSMSVEG